MASLSNSAAALHARLVESLPTAVGWSTAEDLSRISLESLAARQTIGRELISTGLIRLTGDGAAGSSAAFDVVGDILNGFQKLVTSAGAAREGHKSARGPLPASVTARTALRLLTSPSQGSVVLEFLPQMAPADELNPGGAVPLIGEEHDQLADLAVRDSLAYMEEIKSVGPDADGSDFLEHVSANGPRFAHALRKFAQDLDGGDLDTDFEWRQPHVPTLRVTIRREDARRIASLISTRELDAEPVVVEGVLRTISDLTNLVVELATGELQPIAGGDLPPDVVERATIHTRVRIAATMTIEQRPGGIDVAKYRAVSMELLD